MGVYAYEQDAAVRAVEVADSIRGALTTRVVTRDNLPLNERDARDLKKGVVTVLSAGEEDFPDEAGFEVLDGSHGFGVMGDIQLPEDADPSEVEDAELAMVGELKGWIRAVNADFSLGARVRMIRWTQSGQERRPFGWFVAQLRLVPSK